MHAAHGERILKLRPALDAPRLSVLIPFYKHDPAPLLRALARMTATAAVEIVALDDGGGSASLLARALEAAECIQAPTTLIVWGRNRGRAHARNRLIAEARGGHVLFLDADMIPEHDDFLDIWLDLIARDNPAAAFGGFCVNRKAAPRRHALHAFLAARSDLGAAHERARDPAQFTATSNLLVRRDVMAATPFDDKFVGWGWEDVDWALRAAKRAGIAHIDNRAHHAGFDDVETLMRKFRESGPNYARLVSKHPDEVRRFRSYRAARLMRHAPGVARLRAWCAWLARDPLGFAPLQARSAALKLYRTAIYAEHMK